MTTNRRSYAFIYLPIDPVSKRPLLRDDGRAEAFTDWAMARDARAGFIVTNWSFFAARILPTLTGRNRPTALRVCALANWSQKVAYFHAELDAPDEQMRTLNQRHASDANHGIRGPKTPKVWEEKQ